MVVDISVEIAGLKFRNPILNAACPVSRNGQAMKDLAEGGVGGLVAKTISVKAAPVPFPNMGVVDKGVIKGSILTYQKGGQAITRVTEVRAYYGFLNAELWSELSPEQWLEKELPFARKVADEHKIPLIASIGYKPHELAELGPKVVKAGAHAVEFSTHYLGHDYKPVVDSAKALREAVDVPIFPKLSPHTWGLQDLIKELENVGVDGIVAINTLGPTLHIDIETGKPIMGGPNGHGWLSGPAIKPLGVAIVAEIAKHTNLPIIGVGGISKPEDVIEYIMVGATAVQVCTAGILYGPKIYGELAEGVAKWLKEHGYDSLEDIRGKALKYLKPEPKWVYPNKPPAPIVDEELCIACGYCEKHCIYDAVHVMRKDDKRVAVVDESKCFRCGVCTTVCPTRAIHFTFEY
jgi:dihydroorotate dehydrogenase subfamily 1